MTKRRFDMGPASDLQSRDGLTSKGGLIKNGFVEKDRDGAVWSWQRPGLYTGTAAPFTGTALGLILHGGTLYGVAKGTGVSTATSFSITLRPGPNRFTLYAGTVDSTNFGYNSALHGGPAGNISPLVWGTFTVGGLYVYNVGTASNLGAHLLLDGASSQSALTSLKIGATTLAGAAATFVGTGGFGHWTWANLYPYQGPGVYNGSFSVT